MTSTDRNDLMPAQEDKGQKWVTPKISLMEAEDTEGKLLTRPDEEGTRLRGPS